MADAFVDRGAATPREVIVIQGRRVGILTDYVVVDCFVNGLGCRSDLDCTMTSIQCLSTDDTDFFDLLNLFGSMDRRVLVSKLLEMSIRSSGFIVVWLFNMIRNSSVTHKRVRVRSERPRKLESRLYLLVSFFVTQLVETPQLLETVLAAEITGFNLEFDAGGAL